MCSYEDCWNRATCLDEVAVKLESGHRGHVDVGDQAGRVLETGREEIGCRRKNGHPMAQRPHQPSHRLAKRLIVIDDRD
jgi:hypothetical protein